MVERFFFDGVNAKTGRTPVSCKYDLFAFTHAHKAGTALAVM
jgi:hypothetical protein